MEQFIPPEVFNNTCPQVAGPLGLLLANLVQSIIAKECNSFAYLINSYPSDYGHDFRDGEEFDFIVVGAGSAGSVVASRLAENANWRILLLEAGGNPTLESEIPRLTPPNFLNNSSIDWNYTSISNGKSCLAYENGRCDVPRGKALGGSSSINNMIYVRGSPEDYNGWARQGNRGWSYKGVLPYFKKLENFGTDNWYHSSQGPLTIETFYDDPKLEPLKTSIQQGFADLGYRINDDFAGFYQTGIGKKYGTLYDRMRANTAKMYLNPTNSWGNLKVIKNAFVEKVLFKGDKVTGVVFSRKGIKFTALARKEVILSAGAINTPKLLMLSGVGSKKELQNLGINVVRSLEGVGKNLQEHPRYVGMEVHINQRKEKPISDEYIADATYLYLTRKLGPFGGAGLSNVVGFVDSISNSNVPDVEIVFGLKTTPKGPSYIEKIRSSFGQSNVFEAKASAIETKSRGYVKLKSANPD